MEFKKYKLEENPFRITPSLLKEEIIWAGMPALKEKIDMRIGLGAKTNLSRIVLNWGMYGSGKTHAALYYTKTDYLEKEKGIKAKGIKVNLPRAGKVVLAFWKSLLGQLRFETLLEDFAELEKMHGEATLSTLIENYSNNPIVADLIKWFMPGAAKTKTPQKKQKTIFPEGGEDNGNSHDLLKEYLYGDASKTTLKTLGLPTNLFENDEEIVNIISCLFGLLTHEKQLYQAVFLWVDEFEDISSISSKSEQDRISAFFRQLIDKTPNSLTLFINFTPSRFLRIDDLSMYLGEALSSRAKTRIEFAKPSKEEALGYLQELINNPLYRNSENQSLGLFPFTEDSAKYVLSHLGELSIRKINEAFAIILEMALIAANPPEILDKTFIDSISEEIVSWEN